MNKMTKNFLLFTACLSLVLFFGERLYSQNDLSIVKVATERPARLPNQVRSRNNDFSFKRSFKNGRQDDERLIAELEEAISNPFQAGQWPRKSIAEIDLNVRERKNAPKGIAGGLLETKKNAWSKFAPELKVYAWVAPEIRYQPLYFEDVALERYGQTSSERQELIHSTANFFTSAFLLPYHMRRDAPLGYDYPLGFCRPGDVAPRTKQRRLFPR
jgi:hypothetical protein